MILDALTEYVLSHLLDRAKGVLPDSVLKRLDGDTSLPALLERDILPKSLEALVARRPDLQAEPDLVEQVIAPAIAHIIQHSVLSGQPGAITDLQAELDKLLAHDLTPTQRITCAALLEDYQQVFYAQLAQHQSAGDALIMQHLALMRAQVDQLRQMIALLSVSGGAEKVTRKPRIFISYARADDEAFAERLYHVLKDDFEVWWDRVSMPNRGLTFLQEIRDAIDGSDRLLLVAGPGAFTSEYVRDEWRYAYENYKGINIALRLGDYPDLPDQIGGFDAPDFRDDANYTERLATLRRQLAEPVAPIGQLHSVPALPPHFLKRPDALDALRALVIADVDKPTLISAEKRTTAVEGMGGIGKSVVATAFAHDRKVRFAFPDGIVWLTVGHTPGLFELYRAVGVALGDDFRNYPDETTARQNAQKMLAGKKCLIILDDVWELTAARAFRDLISGTTTRLLITTRNLQINDLLGANEYRLKLVDRTQAADYLRSWVGDDPDLEKVAQKLGYLFLALKLAGARMKRGSLSGAKYLQTFDRVSRMKVSPQSLEREDNLEVSITLSVEAAFAGAETDKLLYHTLGIFAEDTPIPQQTLLQLWQHLRPDVDEFDLGETLNALVDLALVERDDQSILTLHDLLHSYTREKLGERYVQTHNDLLESYGVETWHELPSGEPYLWRHIAYHLIQAGQADRLYALLTDYRWLQAKLDATDSTALETDCATYIETVDDGGVAQLIRLLQSALTMSTHVLNEDKSQLPYRLTGRLWAHREKVGIFDMWTAAQQMGALELLPTQAYPPMEQAGGALLRILSGHTSWVSGALIMPDGRILSWSHDRTLRLWSSDGQVLSTLSGHSDSVDGALIMPDGRILSWSRDKTLRLWSSDGQALATLSGHTDEVIGALVTPDGRILSWSEDSTLRLWLSDSQALATLSGHTAKVRGALLTPDGRLLSWSGDHTLRLWSSDGQPLTTLSGHTHGIIGALITPDNRILSWSGDHTLRLWSSDGQALATLSGHATEVSGALITPNGQILSWAEGLQGNTLHLWSSDGQSLGTLSGHNTLGVRGALLTSDGRILSWSIDGTLRLWSSDGRALAILSGHNSAVWGALLTSDGRVLSWSIDGTLRLWSSDGQTLAILSGHNSLVWGALIMQNRRVLSWSDELTLRLWSLDTKTSATSSGHTNWASVLIMSNGRVLSWSRDHNPRLWSLDGQSLATLSGHTASVKGALLTPDDRVLSWSCDGTLRLWSSDGQALATLSGHTAEVGGALITPDGRFLSWSCDGTLRLWSSDGQALATLSGHTSLVNGALITPDGRILSWSRDYNFYLDAFLFNNHTLPLWPSDDHTLRLWSSDGQALATLSGHTSEVRGALVMPDGRFLSWAYDNTLRLWSSDGRALATLSGHTKSVWGALVMPDRSVLSWSRDATLRMWSSDGQELATLSGHTDEISGALIMPDGRILSWSRDAILRLWSSDGQALAVLSAWESSQDRLIAWGALHGVDVRCLYQNDSDASEPIFARSVGNQVWVHGAGQFIGDAHFNRLAISDQTIVVGDEAGRVIFLRVRG